MRTNHWNGKHKNQYKEINEPKSGVFEEISKIDRLLKKERWRDSSKIRKKEILQLISQKFLKRIIRKYYEKLYSNKLDNLKEIDTFLETYSIPKLNHDKIENLNRLITSRENESVIKNLPTNKCSGRTRWLHW